MSEKRKKLRITPILVKGLNKDYRNVVVSVKVNPFVLERDRYPEVAISNFILDNDKYIMKMIEKAREMKILRKYETFSKDDGKNYDVMVEKDGAVNTYYLTFGIDNVPDLKIFKK